MKINKTNEYEIQSKYLENHKQKENLNPRDRKIKEDERDVEIHISKSSRTLINKINESKEVGFSQKVENIRKALLEGKYTVSSDEVADKILETIEGQKGSE